MAKKKQEPIIAPWVTISQQKKEPETIIAPEPEPEPEPKNENTGGEPLPPMNQ